MRNERNVAAVLRCHSYLYLVNLNKKIIKLLESGIITTKIGKCSVIYLLAEGHFARFSLFLSTYLVFLNSAICTIYPYDKCQGNAKGAHHYYYGGKHEHMG